MLAVLLALAISALIPPMQSPDEPSHLARAYMISRGQIWLVPGPASSEARPSQPAIARFVEGTARQGRLGGQVDVALVDFMEVHLAQVISAEKRLTTPERIRLSEMNWTSATSYFPSPGTAFYLPAIYMPHALGLAAGRFVGLGVEASYRLARVVTTVCCLLILVWTCRLWVPSPFVWAVILLPMSVFQMLSPTIDGLTMSIAVLAMGLFLTALRESGQRSWRASIALAICVGLLAASRTHLLPLLVLPYFVAWRRRAKQDLLAGSLILALTLAWLAHVLEETGASIGAQNTPVAQILRAYVLDPSAFFRVLSASLTDPALASFYQRSFVGILGWLDTPLPNASYTVLWIGLLTCALFSIVRPVSWNAISAGAMLIGLAVAITCLVFLAMLITWTPHPAQLVQGVQGRYFAIPAILAGAALDTAAPAFRLLSRRAGLLVLFVFAATSLSVLCWTLVQRYH